VEGEIMGNNCPLNADWAGRNDPTPPLESFANPKKRPDAIAASDPTTNHVDQPFSRMATEWEKPKKTHSASCPRLTLFDGFRAKMFNHFFRCLE
jgi:hypothetical protein